MSVAAEALVAAVPHVVVDAGVIVDVGPEVAAELGCDPSPLLRRVESIGTRLDDATFDQLLRGESVLRVRLGPELLDRPVRLRRLGADERALPRPEHDRLVAPQVRTGVTRLRVGGNPLLRRHDLQLHHFAHPVRLADQPPLVSSAPPTGQRPWRRALSLRTR